MGGHHPAGAVRPAGGHCSSAPQGVNLFSELFYAAADKPEWHAARFTVYDTDALDAAEVEQLRAEMPENSFAREYLCDFAASGDEQVLS